MTYINIFKVDYSLISSAIQRFTIMSPYGDRPNFIVMSLDTLKRVEWDNIHLTVSSTDSSETLDFSHKIMGVPIAINNTLKLGEIKVV